MAICFQATKLYCFVHKVPVCGECICFPEHQICVVQTYSEWVIDGEYDWPPKCCLCHAVIEEGTEPQTTRLGCLHIIHTNCLVSHIKGFPPHTAPAGYVCPSCSTPIWPPKSIKDSGSRLHSKLKEAIMQTGLEKNLFGNHPVSLPATESRTPPPAFSSDPLMHVSSTGGSMPIVTQDAEGYSAATGIGSNDIVELDGPSSVNPSLSNQPNFPKSASPTGPAATTRKSGFQFDRQNSEISYYADDDEDGNQKKYTRRGTFRHKFLRALLPFWSSALPTLPVTAPPRKDASNTDDVPQGRVRHQRSSRMDPRKILLVIAIMACMATMGILYYRLAQRGFGEEELPDDEQAVI
ncbi:hypothetical protein U1Q18_035157 [Sarracenia purpurea var. burkii]